MHEVQAKAILSAGKNGMNLYRGCTHGCIYCDARSRCYQMKHEFEDIEVKINAPELLEQALRHKRKKCMIGTGAMSDPYLHLEEQYELTRKCLQIIAKYGFGLAVQTKSARIMRDIDLLASINQKSKCVVQMTLTTYDEALCKKLEPNVSTTKERFDVLMEMKQRGIPTVVWMTPILPFINDTKENILGLLEMCAEADVKGIISFGLGLTLREGSRDYYYEQLDDKFPGMKERYHKTYGYAYEILSPNGRELWSVFSDFCKKHGMMYKEDAIFTYLNTYEEKGYEQLVFPGLEL